MDRATEEGTKWITPETTGSEPLPTFKEYSKTFLQHRPRPLKPKTYQEYVRYLSGWLLPAFGNRKLDEISSVAVARWHSGICPDAPSQRAHVYGLGHAVMAQAVLDELIDKNPFTVKRALKVVRASHTELPTNVELSLIIESMPARYRLAVLLAAACGLRSGEVRALQRQDFDTDTEGNMTVHINRGVTQVNRERGGIVVGTPKSAESVRTVGIPPWLVTGVNEHLEQFTGARYDSYVFTSEANPNIPLSQTTLGKHWRAARDTAGTPKLRFHDLRHYAATIAVAVAGASEDEARRMLGQSDLGVTRLYLEDYPGWRRDLANRTPNPLISLPLPAPDSQPIEVEPDETLSHVTIT